jgi:hypothetical protein
VGSGGQISYVYPAGEDGAVQITYH